MFIKTKGILISSVKYTDHSSIVTMFLRDEGLVSFLWRKRASLLTEFEVEFNFHENKQIQYFKVADVTEPYKNIGENMYKTTIIMFLAEVLRYALKGEKGNSSLYDYIINDIRWLDSTESDFSNFHIIFLSRLLKHLGYDPVYEIESFELADESKLCKLNHNDRNQLTSELLEYYRKHIPDFPVIKSFEVLKEIFV